MGCYKKHNNRYGSQFETYSRTPCKTLVRTVNDDEMIYYNGSSYSIRYNIPSSSVVKGIGTTVITTSSGYGITSRQWVASVTYQVADETFSIDLYKDDEKLIRELHKRGMPLKEIEEFLNL